SVRLHEVASGKQIADYTAHKAKYGSNGVSSVVFLRNGATLVTGSEDNTIRFWEGVTGKELRRLSPGQGRYYIYLSVSGDGRGLASTGADQTLRLWEVATGEELRQFRGHSEEITGVVFAPDGRTLASSSRDFTLLIWDRTGLLEGGRLPRL